MGKGLSSTGLEQAPASSLSTGSFTATGQSVPVLQYTSFNVSIWGTFVGTIQPERSFDGGVNWLPLDKDTSGTPAQYTTPVTLVMTEPEKGVIYRLNCTSYTSGTANYRVSGSGNTSAMRDTVQ